MKKNIRLKNITITNVQYPYQLKDIIKEIKKFIEVDDSEFNEFFELYKDSLSKNEVNLNIDICTCGSIQTIKQMFSIHNKDIIQKGRKQHTVRSFMIRNETKNEQTLMELRRLNVRSSELKIGIEKFRNTILKEILENPFENDNNKIIKDFYSIERSFKINQYVEEYDKKISKLLEDNESLSQAQIILNRIEKLIENDEGDNFSEFDAKYNVSLSYNNNYYIENTIMLHSEWCQPTSDGTGDVDFEACNVFADLSIGNNLKISNKTSLKDIAKKMNALISNCGTLTSSWKLIYDTSSIRQSITDCEYLISIEEITTKLDRQYYNLTQIISQYYINYSIVLSAIETEILYNITIGD